MPRINHIPDPNARKIIEQSDKTFGNRYKKQKEHHRKMSFQEEYKIFLKNHRVDYDEKFVWH